jgi:hypothetical protein
MQKRAFADVSAPHDGQLRESVLPQAMQKRASAAFAAPHC